MSKVSKPVGQGFFELLRRASGARTDGAFADRISKKRTNVSSYLSGARLPGSQVMFSAAQQLLEWNVQPVEEIGSKKPDTLPSKGGVYVFYDSAGQVVYIGKAKNLKIEVKQTLKRSLTYAVRLGPDLKKSRPCFNDLTERISAYEIPSSRLRHNLEALLQRVFANQLHNANLGQFK